MPTNILDDTGDYEGLTEPPSAWPDQVSWWKYSVAVGACEQPVTMGHCANGFGFVAVNGIGGVLELRVFTPSGSFASLQISHDYETAARGAMTYWPQVIDCRQYTVEKKCVPR